MGLVQLSDDDISYAEKLLLGDNKFDINEKIPIIKCMDKSINVMACPGSGKTTTLLGKIIALLNHMPLQDGKGVCIITHTNVAINEIKNKLGSKSDILFQYPNFIGTIQSFTDKFLAGPFIKLNYGKSISSINDDFYYKKMFYNMEYIKTLRNFAYRKRKSQLGKGMSREEQNKIKDEYIKSINVRRVDGKFDFFSGEVSLNLKNPKTETYKALYGLFINNLLEQGILRYSDTYLLAQMYIEGYPMIATYFAERFQYVFMDEVQDNSCIQNDIFSKIFSSNKIIVQKFGDLNQAIYEDNITNNLDKEIFNFEISHSMRFSQSIANFIGKFRVEKSSKPLIGNGSTNSIVPHVLVYKPEKINEVKNKYIELIKQHGLDKNNNIFKCCGWVGYKEKEEQLSVKSYFSDYQSNKDKSGRYMGLSLKSILSENIKSEISVRVIYKSVIECMSRFLNLNGVEIDGKKINVTILERYMVENLQEQLKLLRICVVKQAKEITLYKESAFVEIGKCAYNLIKEIITDIKEENFVKLFELQDGDKVIKDSLLNKYTKDGVTMFFDTVHGVKGETHTSTLYLETYYNKKTDLMRIFKFITKDNIEIKSEDDKKSLKVAYVGMSRATDLLCIATCEDTFKKYEKDLIKMEENEIIRIIQV